MHSRFLYVHTFLVKEKLCECFLNPQSPTCPYLFALHQHKERVVLIFCYFCYTIRVAVKNAFDIYKCEYRNMYVYILYIDTEWCYLRRTVLVILS